jgi:hypothetical protein
LREVVCRALERVEDRRLAALDEHILRGVLKLSLSIREFLAENDLRSVDKRDDKGFVLCAILVDDIRYDHNHPIEQRTKRTGIINDEAVADGNSFRSLLGGRRRVLRGDGDAQS